MCINTVKKQKFLKNTKFPRGGCATPLNVPKLGVSGVKDIAKKLTKIVACHVAFW